MDIWRVNYLFIWVNEIGFSNNNNNNKNVEEWKVKTLPPILDLGWNALHLIFYPGSTHSLSELSHHLRSLTNFKIHHSQTKPRIIKRERLWSLSLKEFWIKKKKETKKKKQIEPTSFFLKLPFTHFVCFVLLLSFLAPQWFSFSTSSSSSLSLFLFFLVLFLF